MTSDSSDRQAREAKYDADAAYELARGNTPLGEPKPGCHACGGTGKMPYHDRRGEVEMDVCFCLLRLEDEDEPLTGG